MRGDDRGSFVRMIRGAASSTVTGLARRDWCGPRLAQRRPSVTAARRHLLDKEGAHLLSDAERSTARGPGSATTADTTVGDKEQGCAIYQHAPTIKGRIKMQGLY
ncbi:hypothetical protein MRX96_016537 [Rhipicephalus microplus]